MGVVGARTQASFGIGLLSGAFDYYTLRASIQKVSSGKQSIGTLSEPCLRRLPEIKLNVKNLLNSANRELLDLPVPSHSDPRGEIIALIRNFARRISKDIVGYQILSQDDAPETSGMVLYLDEVMDLAKRSVLNHSPIV